MGLPFENEACAERAESRRQLIKYAICFGVLFCAVFFMFWWSGNAIRFSAGQITASNQPTYRVYGAVHDAQTGRPLPWAVVEDDASGSPPFFRAEADQYGAFSLATLPLSHQVRVTRAGYRDAVVKIGRPWFVWWPKGEESITILLVPE